MIKRFSKPLAIALFSLLVSLPLIVPYFHAGYFPTHDGEWAVVRLGEMFRSLKDHQFPVRFSGTLNMEYGYPLFNFAYPFPYYVGILLYALKFGFIGSIKILFAVTVPLSVYFMFLLSEKLWKNTIAGAISAILFAYLPYRIVDLYARGSLGESISFVFFPLLFYIVLKISEKKHNLSIIFGSLSYAALIMSHNIMALYATPLLIIFIGLLVSRDRSLLKPYLIMLVSGVVLSSFFWVPAIFEKHLILLSQIPIANRQLYFVKLSELIIPKWGYGLPTQNDGFSYQLGFPQIILFFLTLGFLASEILKKKLKKSYDIQNLALVSLLTIFMMLFLFSFTGFFWKEIPLLKEINYPWTLLLPIGFLMCLSIGYVNKMKKPILLVAAFICTCAIIFTLPHAKPQSSIQTNDQYYLTNEATTTSSHEYMPLWVKKVPLEKPKEKVEVLENAGTIHSIVSKSNAFSFTTDMQRSGKVRVNTMYYPGWKIFVDSRLTSLSYQNTYGVMDISVPAGEHVVRGQFGETPLRFFADLLSIIGLFFVLSLFHKPLAKKII